MKCTISFTSSALPSACLLPSSSMAAIVSALRAGAAVPASVAVSALQQPDLSPGDLLVLLRLCQRHSPVEQADDVFHAVVEAWLSLVRRPTLAVSDLCALLSACQGQTFGSRDAEVHTAQLEAILSALGRSGLSDEEMRTLSRVCIGAEGAEQSATF